MKQFRSFIYYRRLYISSPIISIRSLYSQEALGITSYIKSREKTAFRLKFGKVKSRERMALYVENPEKYEILTDDVRNMINVIKNESDVELCSQVLKRFRKQSKDIDFLDFAFGPAIMRCCHYLKFPDVAFEFLKDEEYGGIFNQVSSFVIAMDLLLETGNYQKLLEVFEMLKKKQFYENRFPTKALTLAFACCYKLNTPESYKYAVTLLEDATVANFVIPRRAVQFVASLALKQNDPLNALEVLRPHNPNYYTVRNLTLMSFADLDRLEDVFIILNDVLSKDYSHMSTKETVFPEIIEKLEAAAVRNGKIEILHKMEKMIQALKEGSFIMSTPLDEFLFETILSKTEQQQINLDVSNKSQSL